ncbi:MAG: hypothetical protein ACPIOQ_48465 [Promethearchaeia archaeon]
MTLVGANCKDCLRHIFFTFFISATIFISGNQPPLVHHWKLHQLTKSKKAPTFPHDPTLFTAGGGGDTRSSYY